MPSLEEDKKYSTFVQKVRTYRELSVDEYTESLLWVSVKVDLFQGQNIINSFLYRIWVNADGRLQKLWR